MRIVSLVLAVLFFSATAFASEIREFSVSILEQLGNELYRRDRIAARATDVVLETQPIARSLKMRGWITDLHKDGDVVYLIVETSSGPALAYAVTFHGSAKPQVEDRRGQPLPPNVAVRYKAEQTALQALKGRLFNIGYNFEVLDDPDGSGFLVYALGSSGKAGQVVLAGHVRVSVSGDGSTVKRIDPLSQTLMIEDEKHTGLPKGTHLVASNYNQIVSNKPVETLIYTSRLSGRPIFVQTPDGKMWQVANGKIRIDKSKPGADTIGAAARKAFNENGR